MAMGSAYRRCIAILLVLVSMLSLCGCGSKGNETPVEATESEVALEAEAPQNDATTEEPNTVATPTDAPSVETASQETAVPIEATAAPTDSPVVSATPEPTPTPTPAPTPTHTPVLTATPAPTPAPTPGLTSTQRNSINMLNYMSALTQQINEERKNQLFLESAYDSFDNLYPNAVDAKTQAQITSLMDTIQGYRMISAKRARLEYINEQNRAQALRQAIPNPMGLLSAVQSGSLLKAAASVLYMVVDSATSYNAAISQADLQYIKEGWELDDAESSELHTSTKTALTYLLEMVRTYDLPGDYALSREAIEDFVSWSSKPNSQLERKISWLESHRRVYKEFGPYWLKMVKDYYNAEEYEKCLDAISQYESVRTRIFRIDIDYATALPMAIVSAKETLPSAEYVKVAEQYCKTIFNNTKDSDWSLRYFAAQTYVDLYAITHQSKYLDEAYTLAHENIINLVDSQNALNEAYLKPVEEVKVPKDASKREKEEIKAYNKLLNEERKTALPPVNEALYLNCELLFALAEEKGISAAEQRKVDAILHEDDANLFLTSALDARFWFTKDVDQPNASEIEVSFDGEKLTIPAICISDRSTIAVTITGPNGTTVLDDWTVKEVKRPKNAGCDEFVVTLVSKFGKDYKYQDGETITIKVVPVAESPEEFIEFTFKVTAVKKVVVFNGISFERVA